MKRRDPLLVSGVVVALLFVLLLSVVGRMLIFMRFVSMLLVLALLVFGGIVGYRLYLQRDNTR